MASKSASPSMRRVSIPKGGMDLGGLIPGSGATAEGKSQPPISLHKVAIKKFLSRAVGGNVQPYRGAGLRHANVKPMPDLAKHCQFVYRMNVLDRKDLLAMIQVDAFDNLCEEMGVTKEYLLTTLKMSAATLGRKAKSESPLSSDEAEKVLGVVCLIGQVAVMVEESGDSSGFDAAKWFAEWIKSPNAALGGRRADELLSFGDGRQLLSGLLSQMQAGTYA